MTIKPHPLADLFPMMSDEMFSALVADIRENGLREPIILHEGMILDGRNRHKACVEVGVEPITRPWDQRGSALSFVVSKNLHRRHLSESQRAMVAAKIANMGSGVRTDLPSIDGRLVSQPQAAKLLNVSTTSVERAVVIRDKGVPELQSAVDSGKTSVWAAREIANKPQEEQRVIVARGEKAITEAAKESRASRRPKDKSKVQERIEEQRMRADLWVTLRDALLNLTSLPLPSEMVMIARMHDKANLVDGRLHQSLEWLNEFASVWHAAVRDKTDAA